MNLRSENSCVIKVIDFLPSFEKVRVEIGLIAEFNQNQGSLERL